MKHKKKLLAKRLAELHLKASKEMDDFWNEAEVHRSEDFKEIDTPKIFEQFFNAIQKNCTYDKDIQ